MDGDDDRPVSALYEYSPLDDVTSQIRLLEIIIDSHGLECPTRWRLSTFEITRAPEYHTISYTLGPQQPTEEILLGPDLAAFTVRQSCADVLRQLTQLRSCQYYWLDAL
jgi:hypothetical protein